MSDNAILLIGASVRAAAASMRRLGLQPYGLDLFGDRDTQALCAEARHVSRIDYPYGFAELHRLFPSCPFRYTGALENYPKLIETLSTSRPLLGNDPATVKVVRNPQRLQAILACHYAEVWTEDHEPSEGVWMCKPLDSAGGSRISRWVCGQQVNFQRYYLQRYIPGMAIAATFRDRELLGVTEQLLGRSWLPLSGLEYQGSFGPIPLTTSETAQLREIAERLQQAGLCDYYGIDFIRSTEGLKVVEVNPRYTASVEVLELAAMVNRPVAKCFLTCPFDSVFPEDGPWMEDLERLDPWRFPNYADIPAPGKKTLANHPICTIFAQGSNLESTLENLRDRVNYVREHLSHQPVHEKPHAQSNSVD